MVNNPQSEFEVSRRDLLRRGVSGLVLLAGASAFLGGCASGGGSGEPEFAQGLPDINWPRDPLANAAKKNTFSPPAQPKPMPQAPTDVVPTGVLPRTAWARGGLITNRMNRADRPYSYITVHHDGINAFTNTSQAAAAGRLEMIRKSHLNRSGEPFGDIGYHYLIDPAGRVWQGRPLQWQGAHVKGQNPGNLGICVLGNYNEQTPNRVQLARLNQFVAEQMRTHRVPLGNVKTHREWASTECPGESLQYAMISTRNSGGDLRRMAVA